MSTHACCVYDFTLYDKEGLQEDIKKALEAECKSWCFQLEQCPSTGRLHFQGRLSLKMKKRLSGIVALFKETVIGGAHFTVTSSANRDNNFYVMKSDSKISGPWKDDDVHIYIPRQYREVLEQGLYPWQQAIMDDVGVWNTRHINMIYDERGCIGKSSIVGIMRSKGLAICIPPMNDYKDVMRFVMSFPKKGMYLVDMPRALDQTRVRGLMSALEEIKGGWAWDDRYKGKAEPFDSPNIWVFTNTLPQWWMFTRDRWRVYHIVDRNLIRFPIQKGGDASQPPLAAGARGNED